MLPVKKSNLIGPTVKYDGRSLAAKRRQLAQMKGTDVMIELLKQAQSVGHHADYVLFDTWFSNPAQLIAAMIETLNSVFRPTEAQFNMFLKLFMERLPEYIRNSLATAVLEG